MTTRGNEKTIPDRTAVVITCNTELCNCVQCAQHSNPHFTIGVILSKYITLFYITIKNRGENQRGTSDIWGENES